MVAVVNISSKKSFPTTRPREHSLMFSSEKEFPSLSNKKKQSKKNWTKGLDGYLTKEKIFKLPSALGKVLKFTE